MILILLGLIPEWLDTFGKEVGDIWPLLVIAGMMLTFLYRSFNKKLNTQIEEYFEPIKNELMNNGGSSIKDTVERVDNSMNAQHQLILDHTLSDTENFRSLSQSIADLAIIQAQSNFNQVDVDRILAVLERNKLPTEKKIIIPPPHDTIDA